MNGTKNPMSTYRYKHLPLALLALSLPLTGCIERGEGGFPDQRFEEPDAGEEIDSGDVVLGGGEGAGTMAGTWLRVHEASTCVLRSEQLVVTDYIVRVDQREASVIEDIEICQVAATPILGLEVVVPPAAFGAVELPKVDRGYVTALTAGAGYTSPTELSLWGFTSSDPIDGELPDSADHPDVYDADLDGQPGVTFAVGGSCARYVTQRQYIRYLGAFTGGNRIEGGSIARTESEVLGATAPICASAPALGANDDDNRFVMVRVDGAGGAYDADLDGDGVITCAEVQGLGVQLIPPREPTRVNCVQ